MAQRIGSDDAGSTLRSTESADSADAAAQAQEQRRRQQAAELAAAQARARDAAVRKRALKGDGMTGPKSLASKATTEKSSTARKPNVPLRPRLPMASKNRLATGDGMTAKRAMLPSANDSTAAQPTQPTTGAPPVLRAAELLRTLGAQGGPARKVSAPASGAPPSSLKVPPGANALAAAAADQATAPEIPAEVLALAKSDPAAFEKAYLASLDLGEPWAKALQQQGEDNFLALVKQYKPIGPEKPLDPGVEPGPDEGQLAIDAALKEAVDSGEPWALAVTADRARGAEQSQAWTVQKLTNTHFAVTPPAVGSGEDTDGSMKVPSPPESALVLGYVRSNPVVQQLREQGMANIYNPLYAKHLQAALAGCGKQGAPPEGPGFLAMTDHGFALCYDPSRSPAENKALAELSCKTGMSFDQVHEARLGPAHGGVEHHDGKDDDALDVFNRFDPTKPGDCKIALDKSGNGHWQMVLKSDGNGFVQAYHEHQPTTWTEIGHVAGQIGLAIAAVVATYFTAGTSVAWIGEAVTLASSVKSTYDAVQAGNPLGIVLGVMGAAGAAGGLASSLGATGEVVDGLETLGELGTVIKGIDGVVKGIENKDLLGALKGVAGVVASTAGLMGSDDDALPNIFDKIASVANKVGTVAAFGQAGASALRNGDYLTAFGSAIDALQASGALDGIDPAVLTKIKGAVKALGAAEHAIKTGDYAGAVESVLQGVQSTVNGANGSPLLTGGVAIAGLVSAISQKDPAKAAAVLAEFVNKIKDEVAAKQDALRHATGDDASALEKTIADLGTLMDKFKGPQAVFGGVAALATAVKGGKVTDIIDQAAGLIATLTQDGRIDAARSVFQAGQQLIAAIKSGDFAAITAAGQVLGNALANAVNTFGQPPPPPPGPLADAVQGPECPDTVEEIKAALEEQGTEPTGDPAVDTAAITSEYTIQSGDNLSKIAAKLLGDANLWPELYFLNQDKLKDPNLIYAGDVLTVPDKSFRLPADVRNEILKLGKGLPKGDPKAPAPGTETNGDVQQLQNTLAERKSRLLDATDFVTKLHDAHRIDDATYQGALKQLAEASKAFAAADAWLKKGDAAKATVSLGVVEDDLAAVTEQFKDVPLLTPETLKHAAQLARVALDNLASIRKNLPASGSMNPDVINAIEEAESEARQLTNLSDPGHTPPASFSELSALSQKVSLQVTDLLAALGKSFDSDARLAQTAVSILQPLRSGIDLTMSVVAPAAGPWGEAIAGAYVGFTHGIDEYMKSGDFQNALYVGLRDAMVELGGAVAGLGPLAWSKKLAAMTPEMKSYFSNVVTATVRAAGEVAFELMAKIKEIKSDGQGNKASRIAAEVAKASGAVLAKGMLAAQSVALTQNVPVKLKEKMQEVMTNFLYQVQKKLVDAGTKAAE